MSLRTAVSPDKANVVPVLGGLLERKAERSILEHSLPPLTHAESSFGHDFSGIAARSQAQANGSQASASCPLFPRTCPFGGACHTCPVTVQAKRTSGQPSYARQQGRVPPIVHKVLRSPGRPLDPMVCRSMESGFGHGLSGLRPEGDSLQMSPVKSNVGPQDRHEREADQVASWVADAPARDGAISQTPDFQKVRIHTGAEAAESAHALDALAYTVGQDIVFGATQYSPQTESGRSLLAHELTHVVQQQASPRSQCGVVQPKGRTFGGFFRNLGRAFADFFAGKEPGYDQETLEQYLKALDDAGDIEGDYDSDNKARAVVNAWQHGGSPYSLTARRKALLIREMQSGVTGDEDERAILQILERSYNFELSYIFGAGGVSAKELNSDFHTREWNCLKSFYGRRFDGGMKAVLSGRVKPIGLPVQLGASLTQCGVPGSFGGFAAYWSVECLLGILCAEDRAVVTQLPKLTVLTADRVVEVYWEYDGAQWGRKERTHAAFSNAEQRTIGLRKTASCPQAARSIIHEVRHQQQPAEWTQGERERDAYRFTEEWSIERGLPGISRFRRAAKGGRQQVDRAEIAKYVKKRYSGVTATPGEEIIGRNAANDTVFQRPDKTIDTRPPRNGDSFQDVKATEAKLAGLPKVDPKEWVCPQTK